MSKYWARIRSASRSEGMRGQLLRGGAGSVVVKGANYGLTMLLTIALARFMRPEGFGTYSFAISVATLLAIPVQYGLPALLIREVAKYHVLEEWGLLRGLLARTNQVVALLSVILVGIGAVTVCFLTTGVAATVSPSVWVWALALVPLIGVANVRSAVLRGLGRVVKGQMPEMLLRPLFQLLFVMVVIYAWKLTPLLATATNTAAAFVACVIGLRLLHNHFPAQAREAPAVYDTQNWFRSLLPFIFLGGMAVLNNQVSILALGFLSDPRQVGLYRVASSVAASVAFEYSAIAVAIGPYVARLHHTDERQKLQKLLTWSARHSVMGALAITLGAIFFGRILLVRVVGRSYAEAHLAVVILCVGQLIVAASGYVGIVFNMTGNENITARAMAGGAVSCIILNLLLIPRWAVTGAAIASMVSVAGLNIYLCWQVWRKLGLDTTAIGMRGVREE